MMFCFTALRRRSLVTLLLLISFSGCSKAKVVPADKGLGKEAFSKFLNAWKDGKKPGDVAAEFKVNEPTWESGYKLLSYEVLPDEIANGSELRVTAKLTLRDPKGTAMKPLNATYAISTSPGVVINRDDP